MIGRALICEVEGFRVFKSGIDLVLGIRDHNDTVPGANGNGSSVVHEWKVQFNQNMSHAYMHREGVTFRAEAFQL